MLPKGRVVRVTGSQLQEDGVKGLEKILEVFDQPGSSVLQVGDTVETRRNGKWGNFGRIVHYDTDEGSRVRARPEPEPKSRKRRKRRKPRGISHAPSSVSLLLLTRSGGARDP